MPKLRNSITKGDGNIAAFIGEEVANLIICGEIISGNYDHDIVKDGLTYDIKTKRCTSAPKPHYECSIAAYNVKQACDFYAFVRVENINGKWGRAFFLGVISKEDYFKKAVKMTAGQRDKSNGFLVRADCWNLPIFELNEFESKEKRGEGEGDK